MSLGQIPGEELEYGLECDRFVEADLFGSPGGGEVVVDEVARGPGFVGGPQKRATDRAVPGCWCSQVGVE
ncbi:hypothetical protein A6A08_24825 [Nocardiopsis sp. TSRI0078]|nr:hypothetical protein A6A08_24825 [Nocardiopsis sp. TSRI0078]